MVLHSAQQKKVILKTLFPANLLTSSENKKVLNISHGSVVTPLMI